MDESLLQVRGYDGQGFQPLCSFNTWQVAALNYLDGIHPENNKQMERHTQTDEVFILVKGRGILVIGGSEHVVQSVHPQEMEIGKVYNVRQNTWHTILMSPDASVVLVEENNTMKSNSEYLTLSEKLHDHIKSIARQFCGIY